MAFLLLAAATVSASESIRFHGQKIAGGNGEFQISPTGENDAVVYVDLMRHVSVVLPYSEEWAFERGSFDRVTAHAGMLTLTVEMFPDTANNDRAYLDAIASALIASKDVNDTTTATVRDAGGIRYSGSSPTLKLS
jgi:hypothetical protein